MWDSQTIVAVAIVFAAAGWSLWRLYSWYRSKSVGACHGCSTAADRATSTADLGRRVQLVELGKPAVDASPSGAEESKDSDLDNDS